MVVAMDPTRPTMCTSRSTKENRDLHICANWTQGPQGHLIEMVTREAGRRDPVRTLTNTECMICLLHLEQRFRSGQRNYDPTAERILVNLLASETNNKR